MYCVVPENIHVHPKFQGEGGFQKPKFLNESMTLKWNFRRGGGFNSKNLPWEGYGYFLEQHIGRHVGGQHGGQNYILLISCKMFDSYVQM